MTELVFKKINKIDKPLAKITRAKTQVNSIRDENGAIKTNVTEIQNKNHCVLPQNVYCSKFEI